mmetsp:Transcript_2452/g.7515  ORF Transcript_2452/g.7515 Transcript_2452/m.7515 type:complete len:329 (+) Transcript_2452:456-1442(+)
MATNEEGLSVDDARVLGQSHALVHLAFRDHHFPWCVGRVAERQLLVCGFRLRALHRRQRLLRFIPRIALAVFNSTRARIVDDVVDGHGVPGLLGAHRAVKGCRARAPFPRRLGRGQRQHVVVAHCEAVVGSAQFELLHAVHRHDRREFAAREEGGARRVGCQAGNARVRADVDCPVPFQHVIDQRAEHVARPASGGQRTVAELGHWPVGGQARHELAPLRVCTLGVLVIPVRRRHAARGRARGEQRVVGTVQRGRWGEEVHRGMAAALLAGFRRQRDHTSLVVRCHKVRSERRDERVRVDEPVDGAGAKRTPSALGPAENHLKSFLRH